MKKKEISDFQYQSHMTSNQTSNTSQNSSISMYGNPHIIHPKKSKCSPNCPLIKSPYIKIRLEAKNLEKSLLNNHNIIPQHQQTNILNSFSPNPFKSENAYSNLIHNMKHKSLVSLEPFVKIWLNQQKKETKSINHNSPKWLEEYELEVSNNKTDKIIIEVYTRSVTLIDGHTPEDGVNFNRNKGEPVFIGFQIFPIKFLDKINKKGEVNSVWLRLINKSQNEYFVTDTKHVLNIENHDPINYKVDDNIVKKEKDIGVPLIKISYEYIDFYNLWLINCSVHSIIQKEDPNNKTKSIYFYRLYIRRNDELEWYKEVTFEEIEKFRNYVCKYVEAARDLPFPSTSIFAYLPLVGSYYSDENNDVLVEKKFILDNFFEQICLNMQTYKLEEFNNFFTED